MSETALFVLQTSVKFVKLFVSALVGSQYVVKGLDKRLLGQRSAALVVDDPTLVEIADRAFCGLERLTGVSLCDSIRAIGKGAFERCYGVVGIKLPKRLAEIPDRMCFFCSSLTSVDLPDVTRIGADAFACCGLKSIYIPASVQTIGPRAFRNCRLERVVLGNPDVQIDPTAFEGNPEGLEIIVAPEARAA